MTPWLTPRHRHDLILSRPVAYVTPCGGAHGRDRLAREARQTRLSLTVVQESLI